MQLPIPLPPLLAPGESCFFTGIQVLNEPGFRGLAGAVLAIWALFVLIGSGEPRQYVVYIYDLFPYNR